MSKNSYFLFTNYVLLDKDRKNWKVKKEVGCLKNPDIMKR